MARSRSRSKSRSRSRSRSPRRERHRHRDRDRGRDRERGRDRRRSRSRSRSRTRSPSGHKHRRHRRSRSRSRDRDDRRRDSHKHKRRHHHHHDRRSKSRSPSRSKEAKHEAAGTAPADTAPAVVDKGGPPGETAEGRAQRLAKLARIQALLRKKAPASGAAAAPVATAATGGGVGKPQPNDDDDDDIDPLDAFMQSGVEEQARKATLDSLAREQAEMKADVEVDLEAQDGTGINMNLHCYICKKHGHTKGQCEMRRCNLCPGETGHTFAECPKKGTMEDPLVRKQKENKRRAQYEAKKWKRRAEAEERLRKAAGIEGFRALYELLGLNPKKLASETEIKGAFRRMSLVYHPDRQSGLDEDERQKAQDKFMEIKTAYELLVEGIRTGGLGAGAVHKAGELAGVDGEDTAEKQRRETKSSDKPTIIAMPPPPAT
eukprot:m.9263 g.9263  ORF g.9263 m.9263 type:complete len:432 (-) comp3458_c0_seq1:106-1401(-)